MNTTICRNSEENETKQLIDKRDGKPYMVTKLKDKNCWMTQNLEIINKTISSTDSDMPSGSFTIPASNKTGFTTSDQYQPKAYYGTSYGGYYNWIATTTTPVKGVELFIGKIGGLGSGSNQKLSETPARSSRHSRFDQSAQVNNLIGEYYHCTDDRITSQCAGSA